MFPLRLEGTSEFHLKQLTWDSGLDRYLDLEGL